MLQEVTPVVVSKSTAFDTDSATGVTLSFSSPVDYDEPSNLGITVTNGEAALHAPGTCTACDQMREMFDKGELDSIYSISLASSASRLFKQLAEDAKKDPNNQKPYRVEIPLEPDSGKASMKVFWCDGDTLSKQSFTLPTETGKVAINTGDLTPFGVERPHVITPPDDEGEDDEDSTDYSFLLGILVFVIIIGTLFWIMKPKRNGIKKPL